MILIEQIRNIYLIKESFQNEFHVDWKHETDFIISET